MTIKWHPLYECQYCPEWNDQQRKLDAQVKALKEKGTKINEEWQKQIAKFECTYVDHLRNCKCKQTYSTIKYSGVLKHLRLCSIRPFAGNEKCLQDYLRKKNISIET